jgi:outer membrane protein assembly factor BamB
MKMDRRAIITVLMTVAAHLIMAPTASAVWDHAHGDATNSGFAKVATAPAVKPQQTVPLGKLAPGAGPVIGPSGTLYVGNTHGQVLAFHPDGTPAWTKLLPLGDPFLASPVVDSEGAVYLATSRKDQGRTHDGGTFTHYEGGLLKLSGDTGAIFWSVPLPGVATGRAARITGGPVAAAPPSILRSGGLEVVVLPVTYNHPGGVELRLLAFAPQNGALLGNTLVGSKQVEVSGSWFDNLDPAQWACIAVAIAVEPAGLPICGISYHEPKIGDFFVANWPMPGVAIADRANPPLVIVSDWLSRDTVGYRFESGAGFTQVFRVHDSARSRTSTPTVLPDGHIVMGTQDSGDPPRGRVTFPGPATPPLSDRKNLPWIAAAPTRLADGKFVVIQIPGKLAVFQARSNTIFGRFTLSGESIASAAASCTHLFVASDGAFTTFDAKTLQQVAQVPWSGGGLSSPVIGPAGHVYSVTHAADLTDSLLVWPPPPPGPAPSGVFKDACNSVVIQQ